MGENKNNIKSKKRYAYYVIHGLSKTRLHTIWHSMLCRCKYKGTHSYKNYGGKGIKVCEEWEHNFMNFYNWAMSNGYKDGLTLDRIDNNKGYSPDNCRWATREEQANNRKTNRFLAYKGETKTCKQWCREYNVSPTTLYDRLGRGWTIEQALTIPVEGKHRKVFK